MKIYQLSLVGLMACLVGCSAAPDDSTSTGGTRRSVGEDDKGSGSTGGSGSSVPGGSGGSSDNDDAPSSPDAPADPSCPDVSGKWSGSVDGETNEAATGGKYKIEGPATATVTGQKGSFTISDGLIDAVVKGTIIGDVNAKQQVQGPVKCGTLTATTSGTVGGQATEGTATCTFKGKECTGEWTITSGGEEAARGTWKLTQ